MWIKLLKDYSQYKTGELVDVDDVIAEAYVKAGYAEKSDEPGKVLLATAVAEFQTQLKGVTEELVKGFRATAEDLKKAGAGFTRLEAGESEDDHKRSFTDYLRSVTAFQKRGDKESFERLVKVYRASPVDDNGFIIRGQEEAQGSNAGFLVPEEYASEVLRLDVEQDVFAARVRTVPMAGEFKAYPALRQTGAPNSGTTSFVGGVQTYRKAEKSQRTASQSAWDEIELKATDLIAYTEATRDLLADAPGAEADFMSLIRMAVGWRRDYDFIRGGGGGEPIGFFNAPCTLSVTRESTGSISYFDVTSMFSKMLPMYINQCEWLASVTTIPYLMNLKDDAGNTLWVNAGNGAQGPLPPTLLNRPVRFSEKIPALGSTGDLNLVVPQAYLEGLRSGVEIAVSQEFKFDTDQVAYRAKLRNDGKPWLKSYLQLADGSNTQVSPFVQLA